MAKIQKGAAIHSAIATPMLITDPITCTAISRPSLSSSSSAPLADWGMHQAEVADEVAGPRPAALRPGMTKKVYIAGMVSGRTM